MSNFTYCSNLTKNSKIVKHFDLNYEGVAGKEFRTKNETFETPLNGKILIDYPLAVVVEEEVTVTSLKELVTAIRRLYKNIYKQEAKSSTKVAMPMYKENSTSSLINRNTTNGDFSIWGHDIGDLCFSSIDIYENGYIVPNIDS